MPNMSSSEAEQTEKVRNQGKPDGLFRACMDKIKESHSVGQALRGAALTAGLLTDTCCYAELLGQFYIATAALEKRIDQVLLDESNSDTRRSTARCSLLRQVKSLGYAFRNGYERDLEYLLGSDWQKTINKWTTVPAQQYVNQLDKADEVELVAAAFILWGPLVIGGGAALKPRVEKAFGKGATNVFEDVVGPGRGERRRIFIELYDSLLDAEDDAAKKQESFDAIVKSSGEFMVLNNGMMMAVRQRPWWGKYVLAGAVAVLAAVAYKAVSYRR